MLAEVIRARSPRVMPLQPRSRGLAAMVYARVCVFVCVCARACVSVGLNELTSRPHPFSSQTFLLLFLVNHLKFFLNKLFLFFQNL